MGIHSSAVLGVCLLASVTLPECGLTRTPDLAAATAPPPSRSTAPPPLVIQRDRHASLRIGTVPVGGEAERRDEPEAFWVALHDSVSDSLFGPDKATPRDQSLRGSAVASQDRTARLDTACKSHVQALRAWPVDALAEHVRPTVEQHRRLQALRETAEREASRLAAACETPAAPGPLHPFERVQQRLQAMLEATEALRAVLRRPVEGLDDGQRGRFEQMSDRYRDRTVVEQRQAVDACRRLAGAGRVDGFARSLLRASRPRLAQRSAMNEVMMAAFRAHLFLVESCSLDRSGNPLDQLEAVRQRLQMSADAVGGMRSALEDYYDVLDRQQKRGFVRLGYGQPNARASLP